MYYDSRHCCITMFPSYLTYVFYQYLLLFGDLFLCLYFLFLALPMKIFFFEFLSLSSYSFPIFLLAPSSLHFPVPAPASPSSGGVACVAWHWLHTRPLPVRCHILFNSDTLRRWSVAWHLGPLWWWLRVDRENGGSGGWIRWYWW